MHSLAAARAFAPAFKSDWKYKPLNLIGPSSFEVSQRVGSQRTINMFPVKPEREGDPWFLKGRPGLGLTTTFTGKHRGWHEHQDRLFIVNGAHVYELYRNGATRKDWGTIASTRGRVKMASLLNVIVIGDGARYYALDLDAETITVINDAPKGRFCVYFNQRILYQGENGQVFYSELNDPTDIDGLNFFTAEALPDEIVAITTTEDQVWLHGRDSTEVWFDSGDSDNPFQRITGGVMYSGCAHPETALRLDNAIWWVERDKEGTGIVRRSNGFTPQRVSTSAVERFTSQSESIVIPTTVELTAYSYQEDGHTFYCLNSERGTWCYDLKTQEWHERAWLNRNTGEQERHRVEFHTFVYGWHLVGDYENGKIYRQSIDYQADAGQEIRATRVTARNHWNGRPVHIAELYLDIATGVGLDGADQGINPKVMLRVSRDGGNAFDNEHVTSLGKIGEYDTQVRFFDLGIGRDWVFEISVSDPVFKGILGGEVKLRAGRR